ncbi:MAG: response regulator, partial [Treponemataceae bacterium]|nr:response regulator [Treponemataceae bacterium]
QTPEKGEVHISFTQDDYTSEYASYEFKVTYEGKAYPEDFVQRLMHSRDYEDVLALSGNYKLGFELLIAKSLLDLMRASLFILNENGKNSIIIRNQFKICNSPKKKDSQTYLRHQGRRVLLVDDNEMNLEIIGDYLEGLGLKVTGLSEPKDILKILKKADEKLFDFILMDLHMPKMDGYTLTSEIKNLENEYSRNIPIIAMTTNFFEEEIKKIKERGMVDYISKPFTIEMLLERLDKIF